VYCSVTGFGKDGPYARRPSYDTVISAIGGLYSLVTPADSVAPIGPAMSDTLSGMFAVQAILGALYQRNLTGHGQVVESSMLGAVCGFLTEPITSVMDTGQHVELNTRQRRAQAYGCVASDGKAFIIHMSVPDRFWRAVADAMERPDWLDDPRFADRRLRHDNYPALDAELKHQALTRTRDEWFARFEERDIPHAPWNQIEDLPSDPQVEVMGLLRDVCMPDGQPPLRTAVSGLRFSECDPVPVSAPPELGQDNLAIVGREAP
jgi:formyl-CoA transferase